MKVITIILIVIGWALGTAATFQILRPQVKAEGESYFPLIVGSLFWWWLLLPAFAIGWSFKAATYYVNRFVDSRSKPPLRSGADNGLYD